MKKILIALIFLSLSFHSLAGGTSGGGGAPVIAGDDKSFNDGTSLTIPFAKIEGITLLNGVKWHPDDGKKDLSEFIQNSIKIDYKIEQIKLINRESFIRQINFR